MSTQKTTTECNKYNTLLNLCRDLEEKNKAISNIKEQLTVSNKILTRRVKELEEALKTTHSSVQLVTPPQPSLTSTNDLAVVISSTQCDNTQHVVFTGEAINNTSDSDVAIHTPTTVQPHRPLSLDECKNSSIRKIYNNGCVNKAQCFYYTCFDDEDEHKLVESAWLIEFPY